MRIYRRKCKCCNEWFIPKYQNQYWCNEICGTKIALERRSKE
ncbi:recombination protein NinG, partial [Escherichia coli]|nr:recombination protein NinG [Escherichia coli]EER5503042.1 recombination protein NinG [Escherichia coli]EEW3444733.1 recombination protein NinG [Escherichia coli]EEZ3211123.1 recombination protein NinG [Escherichia coli]EGJ4480013.1 recombination protein NinG [Escherichia coli]